MEFYNQLSPEFRHSLRSFVNYYFNGSLMDIIGSGKKVDYRTMLMTEASLVEQAFAIYANNIELNEQGEVINHNHATKRAAQYIMSVCDTGYKVQPGFEDWEVELV